MDPNKLIFFLLSTEPLKELDRTGWITAGLTSSKGESVAAHSWGTGLISLVLASYLKKSSPEIDVEKTLMMALIHDLSEAIVSDLPKSGVKYGGVEFEISKQKAEGEALGHLLNPLGELSEELINLWKEYSKLKSIEAQIVLAADRIDMMVHALKLERSGVSPLMLDSFFDNTADITEIPFIQDVIEELIAMHQRNLALWRSKM